MMPTKNSPKKMHKKKRSISMRSTRNRPSALKTSYISDSQSERSFSHRDRSMSMSLKNEKSAFRDTLKRIRFEDKYKDAFAKAEEYKNKYVKQRKINNNLK